jgi:hypothetical protein
MSHKKHREEEEEYYEEDEPEDYDLDEYLEDEWEEE